MTATSADAPQTDHVPLQPAESVRGSVAWPILIALAAFGLYWLSALILESRGGTTHFGADAHLYSLLAGGYAHERLARFHPLTTTLAAAWLKALGPLVPLLSAQALLKAMFAAIGALGVWAAMAAFASVVPRRYAALLGVIYATSLSVWYFSSIEESKIVSATLTAFYIAAYLRLRSAWSVRGAALLTLILLLACLNEIIAGFLVVIPAVDALVQRGWRLRGNWWIGLHALAAPLTLVFLELAVNDGNLEAAPGPEGASHISMLLYYVTQNQYGLEMLREFAARWLLYSIAAPSVDATYGTGEDYAGDYGPDMLTAYLASPVSVALVLAFAAIVAASALPGYRSQRPATLSAVALALGAYAALRATFFLLVYPGECLIFSSSTVLVHTMLVAMPFTASAFPWKRGLLGIFAVLLFITNASFIIGR